MIESGKSSGKFFLVLFQLTLKKKGLSPKLKRTKTSARKASSPVREAILSSLAPSRWLLDTKESEEEKRVAATGGILSLS